MNPYESRGLELPAGCKDLIEALNLPTPEKPPVIRYGGCLADIEGHIATLLRPPPSVRWMMVSWPDQSDFVYLVYANDSLVVVFDCSVDSGHQEAIRNVFQEAGIVPVTQRVDRSGFFGSLHYSLPLEANAAAEVLREVLLRGCVVPERAKLAFHLYGNCGD